MGVDGAVTAGFALPGERLVWKAARIPATGAVLLQVDGGMVQWRPDAGTAEDVMAYRPNPGILSIAAGRVACCDGRDAVVLDPRTGTAVLRVPAQAQMYGGHSSQMKAALSADGCILALCTRPEDILLLDVASGQPRIFLRGDFAIVRHLDFLPHSRRLLVMDGYGRWSLHCLDVGTGQPEPDWPERRIDGGTVAVSPSGRRVAVARREMISVRDFGPGNVSRSFGLEQAVKRCAVAWIAENALAVRTDDGCASIYALS